VFILLCARSYHSPKIIFQSPRLLFQVTSPHEAEFFIVYFSQEGRRITLIDPPGRVELSIGAHLRNALPYSYVSEEVVEEANRVIEVKRKVPGGMSSIYLPMHSVQMFLCFCPCLAPEIEPSVIFVQLLKVLNNSNFNLDASFPLGRKGPLGIRYTRELLIFKGPMVPIP